MLKRLYRRSRRLFHRLPEWVKLTLVGIAALVFFTLGSVIAWAAFTPIPSIDNFGNRAVAQSTKIYDRTGNIVLYDVHGTMRRTAVPLDAISPYIQKATIAIEDDSFYEHYGFRPLAFLRAVWANFTSGELLGQGGSTITQQVVKNALLTQDKKITRKIKEIILAVRLDHVYTKDEILTTYLNENPYGGTIYGVQEASQYFFGIDAKDVDLAQAAYIAALPQAPTRLSPYNVNAETGRNERLETRKNLVLDKMLEHGLITEEEHAEAREEIVQFKDETEAGIKAPHFVFYVREYLESKYGVDAVNRDGLRVITTLDYDLQKKAEEIVAKYAPGMQSNFNASNEGLVAIDPTTGQIITMVGSRGYFDDTIEGKVNVTTSYQEPGSAFKPFVYAAAFEKGYTPETVLFDIPTQFSTACSPQDVTNSNPPCYAPTSFDGNFKGPVTIREALAQSLNVPAVKTLYLVGIPNAMDFAKRMGITTLTDESNYGLSLVLGGGAVTPLELTSAYSVFANDGARNPHTAIMRVEDMRGNVLEEFTKQESRVIEPQIARQISDILSDNVARTPEFGANSPLNFPGKDVAAKTGTTNDYWDVWIMGYTPGIAAGAWAGNNNNEPLEKRIAAFIIAPMWHEFMEYAMEKYPSGDFIEPAPEPDRDSLPPVLRGEWNTAPGQGVHEILYWVNKDSPRSGGTSRGDRQLPYWDAPVQLWATGQMMTGTSTQDQTTGFRIISPAPGSFVSRTQAMTVSAYYPFPQNVVNISYFLNGQPIGSASQPPYAITHLPSLAGPATIQAVAQTVVGQTEVTSIPITVQ